MNLTQKNPSYLCKKCNFNSDNKKDFSRHLLTAKHKNRTNVEQIEHKALCCENCNKEYTSRNSLWYHKKKCEKTQKMPEKCQPNEDAEIFSNMSDKEIIMQLLKQNNDLTQKMIEIASTPSTNNSHNNSNNKQFNMNFFLNDTCKDAMNIDDFIDSLQIETEELENVGKLGYVEGISNIFIRGLKDLDETKRPMHCLDKKRETLYIKNGDAWNKDEKREKVKEVIGKLGHKNFMKLMEWKIENPQYENSETKKHAQYTEIVKQVFTCITPDDDNGINKIIRKVANEVCVDKASTSAVVLS
jgi:hypothetical protein